VAVLGVVVILDDRDVVPLGDRQQLATSSERHRHTGGRLVRRSRVDDPGLDRQQVDAQTVVVDGDRHDGGTGRQAEPPHRGVARVFHSDHITVPGEQPDDEIDCLLGASGDHDLVGVGVDGA